MLSKLFSHITIASDRTTKGDNTAEPAAGLLTLSVFDEEVGAVVVEADPELLLGAIVVCPQPTSATSDAANRKALQFMTHNLDPDRGAPRKSNTCVTPIPC